jgi:sugar phosphate isomerase/epimerase
MSRRAAIGKALVASGGLFVSPTLFADSADTLPEHRFSFCLNTSTINGRALGLEQCIHTAAEAGYDGLEIWIRDLEDYVERGGRVSDLRRRAEDLGLRLESAIGFAQWVVDDPAIRENALHEIQKQMRILAAVGCHRMAASPAGATGAPAISTQLMGERYARLIDLGVEEGVLPQLEFWGPSHNLGTLGEALHVAAACGRPEACLLPDVYHMYKGGSPFDGLRLIDGAVMHMFHLNDYPANPGRTEIGDGDRVFPGDGIAPLTDIIRILHEKKAELVLSLELFNSAYWERPPIEVAKAGLLRMQAAVAQALSHQGE